MKEHIWERRDGIPQIWRRESISQAPGKFEELLASVIFWSHLRSQQQRNRLTYLYTGQKDGRKYIILYNVHVPCSKGIRCALFGMPWNAPQPSMKNISFLPQHSLNILEFSKIQIFFLKKNLVIKIKLSQNYQNY